MDKNTLSQYGWSVVLILILVIMVTLASPFGSFVKDSTLGGTRSFVNLTYTALGMDIPLDEARNCFVIDSAGYLTLKPTYSSDNLTSAACRLAEGLGYPTMKDYARIFAMDDLDILGTLSLLDTYEEAKPDLASDKVINKAYVDQLTDFDVSVPDGVPIADYYATLFYLDEICDDEYFLAIPENTFLSMDEITKQYIVPGMEIIVEEENITEELTEELFGDYFSDFVVVETLPDNFDFADEKVVKDWFYNSGYSETSLLDAYIHTLHLYLHHDQLTPDDVLFEFGGYDAITTYHALLGDFDWSIHMFTALNNEYYGLLGADSCEFMEYIYKNRLYILPSAFAIPDIIDGQVPVTISNSFEHKPELVAIQLPDTVKEIDEFGFQNCENLTRINLQNVTTIRYAAFRSCESLKKVDLSNVERLENSAFDGCSSLEEVILSNKLTKIEDYTFRDCTSLTEITIPKSVTSIGYDVFNGCCGGDMSRFIVKGTPGSYAETYANNCGYAFVAI